MQKESIMNNSNNINKKKFFYLLQPIPYDNVKNCLHAIGADGYPDSVYPDSVLSPAGAALMIDLPILNTLQIHPRRTLNPNDAYLHIIDYPFYTIQAIHRAINALKDKPDSCSILTNSSLSEVATEFRTRWHRFNQSNWLVINADWRKATAVFGASMYELLF
mmetsp:Transcript_3937/g.6035  ORF Transcript_3937/g.6035 Transcript_3937/m.6035 type:complete len:162 (-) Transcript_3937:894-1379(-)